MKSPARVTALIASAFSLTPAAASAAVCALEDTVSQCERKVSEQVARLKERSVAAWSSQPRAAIAAEELALADQLTSHLAQQKELTEATLLTKNTGASPATDAGAASTINDLLSLLRISASSGGVSDGQEEIAVEVNRFLGIPTEAGYKLDATIRKPEVFEPLESVLTDAGESTLLADFKSELNDSDDVTIAFTYSPTTKRLGRSQKAHRDTFLELFAAAEQAVGAAAERRVGTTLPLDQQRTMLEDELEEAIEAAASRPTGAANCPKPPVAEGTGFIDAPDLTFRQLGKCLDDEERARTYMELVEADIFAEFGSLYALQTELRKNQFFRFADLVNNQPQLYLRAAVGPRDKVVGPREASLSLSYEKGWVNVNSYEAYKAASCGTAIEPYQCLSTYLDADQLTSLRRGDRIAARLEYVKTDAYTFQPRADLPSVEAKATYSFVATLAYGRYLAFGARGESQSRVDIGLSHEDVDDEETRQDRTLMTVTYSQRVSDSFVLAVSAVYASKPEFLGAVDKKVSLNVGLNYKLLADESL